MAADQERVEEGLQEGRGGGVWPSSARPGRGAGLGRVLQESSALQGLSGRSWAEEQGWVWVLGQAGRVQGAQGRAGRRAQGTGQGSKENPRQAGHPQFVLKHADMAGMAYSESYFSIWRHSLHGGGVVVSGRQAKYQQ